MEIFIFIDGPNHGRISSSLHMAEQAWLEFVHTACHTKGEANAAALDISFCQHLSGPLWLPRDHMGGHQHIAFERATKETSAEPAKVGSHCIRP